MSLGVLFFVSVFLVSLSSSGDFFTPVPATVLGGRMDAGVVLLFSVGFAEFAGVVELLAAGALEFAGATAFAACIAWLTALTAYNFDNCRAQSGMPANSGLLHFECLMHSFSVT